MISLASAALLASSSPVALYAEPQPGAETIALTHSIAHAVSTQTNDQPVPVPAPESEEQPQVEGSDPQGEDEAAADSQTDQDADPGIVVTADGADPMKDPLEGANEAMFDVTRDIDGAIVAPVASAYEKGVPGPIRSGLRNFLRNLLEPVNALNYLLQLKPGKAFETAGRFLINTTVGIGGLIDVAKKEPFNLPYRRNGFGNTLGYYGVGPGPFLVLPLVGATSLRDLIGSGLDQAVVPLAVGAPFNTPYYAIPAYTINSLEFRIEFDERITGINESDDPYFALRETYLCRREAEIAALKNRPPPRDCSLEAIMAGPEPVSVEPEPAPPEVPAIDETPAPEPLPPEIVYISEEVVQPLPES